MRVLLRLAYNILRLITWPAWGLWALLRRRSNPWISLRIRGELQELPQPRGPFLTRLMRRFRPAHVSVFELRQLVDAIVTDPRAHGLLLSVSAIRGGWATIEAAHHVLLGLRAGGKRLLVVLPEGADQRELWIASAADEVYTTPPAPFSALGPVAQRPYLAGLLGKLGIEVQVFAQGAYKTAAESLARETMSEPEREQLTALLRTIQERWSEAVGARARDGLQGASRALERGLFGPQEAVQLGLVDKIAYSDELAKQLDLEKTPAAGHQGYLRKRRRRLFVPLTRPRHVVCVVRLVGAIGASPNPRGISLAATRRLLRQVRRDPRVSGVILYLDSPGGSAVVSELLHREIALLDAEKPVVAWLGNVAASGGYYLAAATRRIIAQRTTITGSIGVISARPVASALLERVGVRPEIVKLAPHADLHSLRPVSAEEAALLEAETRRYYDRFLEVVSSGRKRPRSEIEPLAGGRVWSGADAHQYGLVDSLGGYLEARQALDDLLGDAARAVHKEPTVLEPEAYASSLEQMALEARGHVLSGLEGGSAAWLALPSLLAGGERVLAYALNTSFDV